MANRSNNIWAKAAAGSPGTNIARAQQSRWTGVPNETIMFLVEDKIGGMLEGISDATERNAAAQMQLDLQKKLQAAAAKYGSIPKEDFRLEMVKLAVEAGLTPDPQVSRSCRRHNFAPDRLLTSILLTLILMQSVTMTGSKLSMIDIVGSAMNVRAQLRRVITVILVFD